MFEDITPSIVTSNYKVFDKYKKLKLDSIFKVGTVYHCETSLGLYLWLEIGNGVILLCMSEYSLDIGLEPEIPAAYHGGKPTLEQVIKHFEWEIDENYIWDD